MICALSIFVLSPFAGSSTPAEVIDRLSKKHLEILSDLTLTEPETREVIDPGTGKKKRVTISGAVGLSRIARPNHPALHSFAAEYQELLRDLQREGWWYATWLVGSGTARLEARTARERRAVEHLVDRGTRAPALPKIGASEVVELALKGKQPRPLQGGWRVESRVVPASDQGCLKCHTSSKLNDPLGVLVYAVRKAETRPAR